MQEGSKSPTHMDVTPPLKTEVLDLILSEGPEVHVYNTICMPLLEEKS